MCVGIKNYTRIEFNPNISYNKRSGIKADDNSEICIFKNSISRNLGQVEAFKGIYVFRWIE